jgi:urease accessory protein
VDSAASAVRAIVGRLELVFAASGGRTVLASTNAQAPLRIVRPFDLGDGRALVQIIALGPGMCGGDEYFIDVRVEPGARAVVIMQTAARLLGMPDGTRASQQVRLNVAPGGHLEYYPGLTIPFRDADFTQRVDVNAASDARVGILETWATGRTGRGEHLAFRRISSRTTVSIAGVVTYAEALELDPAAQNVDGMGILEQHSYVASGFWHGATIDAPLTPRAGVLAAFGQTAPDRVYLRALAMDGLAMGGATSDAVRLVNAAWGLAAVPLRRFTS